jgi:hypothetical protein
VGLIVALVGCSGRAEPAMDMMATDADHQPGRVVVTRATQPTLIPPEPEVPSDLPP